jgi:PAS domain S-box-containing protein
MHSSRRRVWRFGLSGAVAAAAGAALYLIARGGFSFTPLAESWDLLIFVAVLGGALSSLAVHLTLRQYHKTMSDVAERIATCRREATPLAFTDQDSELQALLEPLQILCSAYQKLASNRQAEQGKIKQQRAKFDEDMGQASHTMALMHRDMERLKESYKDLYHKAPVMFFSLDPDGLFVSCNDTMLTTLGYEREDLTGKPYTHLLQPADRAAWKNIHASNAFFWVGEVECPWVRKNGTVIDVLIRTVPILDGDGNFIRSRSAAQDVTLHNRLSQELRARGDELERANTQLRATNRELEDFTSVVSHDLKEPLRTIEAYSNDLAREFGAVLGADGFQSINHLVLASRRLGALIDDLLTLTRAGRRSPAPQSFELHEIVATVRGDLADMLQRRKAELVCDGPLPTLIGDARRITQLLSNLVTNGLKYNESPVPRVMIGASPSAAAKASPGFATLWVRDNGIGIDPRFHEEIFRLFRRLHPGETYEGTGAGLAICKKIVEAHSGRIWVESAPGQGATFYFTLPCLLPLADGVRNREIARPPAKRPAAKETRQTRDTLLAVDHKGPQILLVEDIPEVALLTQKLCQRAGHSVSWVTSAEAAWEYLQKDRPDLVLLDVHLPGMDGLELCRRLRAKPNFVALPIALFTQSMPHEQLSRAQMGGPCHVLTKDLLVQPQIFLSRLQEILQPLARTASA